MGWAYVCICVGCVYAFIYVVWGSMRVCVYAWGSCMYMCGLHVCVYACVYVGGVYAHVCGMYVCEWSVCECMWAVCGVCAYMHMCRVLRCVYSCVCGICVKCGGC